MLIEVAAGSANPAAAVLGQPGPPQGVCCDEERVTTTGDDLSHCSGWPCLPLDLL